MIIACPECSSEFNVPVALIGAEGRKVRCAKCNHEWHQDNPEINDEKDSEVAPVANPYKPLKEGVTATASEIDFDIEDSPKKDEPSFVVPKGKTKKEKSGSAPFWKSRVAVMSMALIVLALGGLYLSKDSAWANKGFMARAYMGLGLAEKATNDSAGIDRLTFSLVQNGESYALELKTNILNLSSDEIMLGALKAEVIDADGHALPQSWKFAPPVKALGGEQSVPFSATLENVNFPDPAATYSVKLSFI